MAVSNYSQCEARPQVRTNQSSWFWKELQVTGGGTLVQASSEIGPEVNMVLQEQQQDEAPSGLNGKKHSVKHSN